MHRTRTAKTARHVRKHFQLRLRQRFQMSITDQEWKELSQMCTDENLLVVESGTRSWHLLHIHGQPVHCLYQWKHGLTTCLSEAAYLESFPPPPEPKTNTTLNTTAQLVEGFLSNAGGKTSKFHLQQHLGIGRSLLDAAISHLKKQGRLMVEGSTIEMRQMDFLAA